MDLKSFWYVAASSKELKPGRVLGIRILDQRIALFRDDRGRAVALEDRCLHRCASLSRGQVIQGRLRCGYHGWEYAEDGSVVAIPSSGQPGSGNLKARSFETSEIDDYVYVRLDHQSSETEPFRIPFYHARGWASIRLHNRFSNNVTNCAENFVDIPHTVFVHPGIFRNRRRERLTASVERKGGSVVVEYYNERANLGIFSWFLNPDGREIRHTDTFHMPNVTCVDYRFSETRRFIITSQSVPVTEEETRVYTDLTYNYGIWNRLAKPVIRKQAQIIIEQDMRVLDDQMRNIKRYGSRFCNTEADVIHVFIESIRKELERGGDPRLLPDRTAEIEFRV